MPTKYDFTLSFSLCCVACGRKEEEKPKLKRMSEKRMEKKIEQEE